MLIQVCMCVLPCLLRQPKKARGGKFARKNFKRKANRAAAEAGVVPGSAEDNDPSAPWYKKPRRGGDKDKAAQAAADSVHDPARSGNNGVWKMATDGSGSFMISAPDCPKFEAYYRAQGILDESEWPAFLASLRTKLPTTFRLSTISGMHYHLLHTLTHALQATPEQNKMGLATSYTYTDVQTKVSSVIDPPTPLAWYPNSLGWYLKAGKSELKTRGNMFAKFREFIMAQYDQGNLNRQEAVSMIPPLLLDVQPHHMVLDMCAAPGSKVDTTQTTTTRMAAERNEWHANPHQLDERLGLTVSCFFFVFFSCSLSFVCIADRPADRRTARRHSLHGHVRNAGGHGDRQRCRHQARVPPRAPTQAIWKRGIPRHHARWTAVPEHLSQGRIRACDQGR